MTSLEHTKSLGGGLCHPGTVGNFPVPFPSPVQSPVPVATGGPASYKDSCEVGPAT